MHNPERNKTHRITSEEDVWAAMHSAEEGEDISDSFDAILDYYEVPRTMLKGDNHKSFRALRKTFPHFCDSLKEKQLDVFFNYFLNHCDEVRLFCFFENLNRRQQESFLNKLLTLILEGDEMASREILEVRKKIFRPKSGTVSSTENAVRQAEHLHFEGDRITAGSRYLPDIIRFLKEDKKAIAPFLDAIAEEHHQGSAVVRNIIRELVEPFSRKIVKLTT
ncbi:hypothetical protein KKA33_01495 [Patescibacteria group bacterium]|nr:hypothetical protein [Patescibacteria group bacterium]